MMIKVQTDRDDQILLEEHCDFIVKILRFGLSASIWKLFWKLKFYILTGIIKRLHSLGPSRVILHSNMRTIHQNFTIDLRNFHNFQVPDSGSVEQLSEYGIQV